jgi:hypothetical protein
MESFDGPKRGKQPGRRSRHSKMVLLMVKAATTVVDQATRHTSADSRQPIVFYRVQVDVLGSALRWTCEIL